MDDDAATRQYVYEIIIGHYIFALMLNSEDAESITMMRATHRH